MEDFPEISNDQIVIMRADSLTGHVLDVNFNLVIQSSQKVFTVFDSLEEAIEQVKILKESRQNVEFVIYGKGKKILKFIS